MINFFNSKNRVQKIQAIKQKTSIQTKQNNYRENSNSSNTTNFSIKVLSNQILEMAAQDNRIPLGKKLDIFV